MLSCIPRSDPGATDRYFRPNGDGVSAEAGKLPYGTLPRLALLGLYAELLRTGEHSVDLGYSFCDTLYALGLREAHELPEQMDRLLRCTIRFDGWVSELSWLSMLGWDDVYDDRWRGVIPQRDTRVGLCGPLAHQMLRHPVRLCMHTLRGLRDSAFALDVYLWDAWRRVGPEPAPRPVDAYHALAEHPVPSPDADALGAFEHALREVRETIADLEAEVRDEPAGLVYALPRETPPNPASSWRLP